MNYLTNDVAFPLPPQAFEDQSVQVLRLMEHGGTILVARSPIADDESLKRNFEQQIAHLQSAMPGFSFAPPQALQIGTEGQIEAIEARSEYQQGDTKVYQLQLLCRIPDRPQALAITYARQQALDESVFAYWESLKAQLCFRDKQIHALFNH